MEVRPDDADRDLTDWPTTIATSFAIEWHGQEMPAAPHVVVVVQGGQWWWFGHRTREEAELRLPQIKSVWHSQGTA